ncbi:MAG: co-chaperone GroES family protein [Candidatus Thorarchaeota archaeon]
MTEISPTKDVIVLRKQEEEVNPVTSGGIVLPQGLKKTNGDKLAVVHRVGEDVKSVKEGDIVVVSPYNIVVAVVVDVPYIFCKEENILAVLN